MIEFAQLMAGKRDSTGIAVLDRPSKRPLIEQRKAGIVEVTQPSAARGHEISGIRKLGVYICQCTVKIGFGTLPEGSSDERSVAAFILRPAKPGFPESAPQVACDLGCRQDQLAH